MYCSVESGAVPVETSGLSDSSGDDLSSLGYVSPGEMWNTWSHASCETPWCGGGYYVVASPGYEAVVYAAGCAKTSGTVGE